MVSRHTGQGKMEGDLDWVGQQDPGQAVRAGGGGGGGGRLSSQRILSYTIYSEPAFSVDIQ